MIFITGGTGFIGKALVRHLVEAGYPVRLLIRPSTTSPDLPRGLPVEVAVSSFSDVRGLRAAMVGVDTVFHLAGGEWQGTGANLMETDIRGAQVVAGVAAETGVRRLFYISHLGADRASAFAVFKAKAISEEHIRASGVPYTILRSAIVYGPGDGFTTGLLRLMRANPFFFLIPDDGRTKLQPLWIEDLVTCMVWAMEDEQTINQTYSIGGPEFLTFQQIVELVMKKTGLQRRLINLSSPYLRGITVFLDYLLPRLPISTYWLDYLAANRTCSLDTIPRVFRLIPARFAGHIDYLQSQDMRSNIPQMSRRGMKR